jgi:hypothetical protein
VVADAGLLAIRVYGPDGSFQTEMGRGGDGPGEFRSIFGLWLTSAGKIGVWDARSRRITTFSPDGELESTRDVIADDELVPGNLEVFFGSFSDDDIALASLSLEVDPREERLASDRWVLARFGPDGTFRRLLGQVRGMRRLGGRPEPFNPIPYVAAYGDSLYVAEGFEAAIAVWDESGVPTRTIELPEVPVTSDDAWSSLEAEIRRRDHELYLEYLALMPRTDEIPQVGGLLIDDRGFVWAKVYDPAVDALWLKGNALLPAPGGEWRVVRPDGELVTSVRMPQNMTPLDVKGDRVLGVARDALDVERVVLHLLDRQ